MKIALTQQKDEIVKKKNIQKAFYGRKLAPVKPTRSLQ